MQDLRDIIKFYRDCYQFDLKGIRIKNFLSNQCEKRFVPKDNDLFHENFSGFPVDESWAKNAERVLFLNSKEKELYAGSVFIKGEQNVLGAKKTAYVPLYIHQLNLTSVNDIFYLSIVETFINPDFIELANSIDRTLDLTFDTVFQNAPTDPFGFGDFVLLEKFIENFFPSWNADDISHYQDPTFNYDIYLKESKKKKSGDKIILSCLMWGIFKKPEGSMGVLHELNQLTTLNKSTAILEQFFKFKDFDIVEMKARDIYLPTTLSNNQEQAFLSKDHYPISQIVGPPGTGKSFTIAALAIDAISNNQSVLIVTRNIQACQVITNIIEKDFNLKKSVIKAYNQVYKRSLIAKLRNAVSAKVSQRKSPEPTKKKVHAILRDIASKEEEILKAENDELQWGSFFSENESNFFSHFKSQWFKYKKRNTTPIWQLNNRLKELRKEKIRLVKKYIKLKINYDLQIITQKKKVDFAKLSSALKEKNLTTLDKKLKTLNFKLVLKAVPLWATTTKEISKCLPLQKEMFDLVIFDEASQCDIASALPVIYRAKNLIAVGDPHQLRHISFLSDNKQLVLKRKYLIERTIPDYRKDSLIDWTNDLLTNPDQTSFLNEHFRSKTDIIQFSNQKFYNNQLKLIRSNPISDSYSSIEIIKTKGVRNPKGVNEIEAKALIDKIQELTNEYKEAKKGLQPSIGIISPFTEQVKYLKKCLSENILFDDIKRHDILVGTPFHFQGEERDIVLISMGIDSSSHFGAVNYLNKKDVFNVLITRARNKQIIFTSIETKKLPHNSLLKEYLESDSVLLNHSEPSPIFDKFLESVTDYLEDLGYDVLYNSIIVSGVKIDLVILHNDKYYCIDLIGFPGEFEDQFSLQNLRILNRMNTPLFFLPYSSWYLEEEKVKANLLSFIEQ